MKFVATFLLCAFSLAIYAQDTTFDGHKWQAPYSLAMPKGWDIERFQIPISFAPQIPYKGVEDIRFTPGWGKVGTDEYWSYAFLWYLDGEVKLDARTIETNLKNYYTGLATINGRNIPKEKFVNVVTSFKELQKDKNDIRTFVGTVLMLDYMQQKPITLNCKVHLRTCSGKDKTFIFHELSPQDLSHKVWANLDQLWSEFKCDKN